MFITFLVGFYAYCMLFTTFRNLMHRESLVDQVKLKHGLIKPDKARKPKTLR
jgi:hypothetical protein